MFCFLGKSICINQGELHCRTANTFFTKGIITDQIREASLEKCIQADSCWLLRPSSIKARKVTSSKY